MPVKIEHYKCSKCNAVFSSEADAIKHEKACYPPEEAEVVEEYQLYATVDPAFEPECAITESTRCVEAVYRPDLEGGTYYTVFGLECDDYGDPVENVVNIAATCFEVDVDYPLTVTATCYRLANEPAPWDELKKKTIKYIDQISDELKAVSSKLKENLNAN